MNYPSLFTASLFSQFTINATEMVNSIDENFFFIIFHYIGGPTQKFQSFYAQLALNKYYFLGMLFCGIYGSRYAE